MKARLCAALLCTISTMAHAQIGSRTTSFNPAVNGFKFSNTLEVEVINDIRMSGFCGGMVYTALDYYKGRKRIPAQTYKPANGTILYNYMWGRQRSSVADNVDKWTELFVNPFGARTSEFFNWGLQGFNGGRLEELKKEIDRGNPVPLGLFKPGEGGGGPHHQVLAIGYNGGRYKGDLGDFKEDLEIMVYDPNFPGVTKILKPDPANNIYYYKDERTNTKCQWQTYFVNRKYAYNAPPVIANIVTPSDGLIRELLLEIKTGADDLRGGNDNLAVTLNFKSHPSQVFNNVNKGARWIGNYTETVPLRLRNAVALSDLKSIQLSTNFGGGIGGDNWNMDEIKVKANGQDILFKAGTPLYRFTASAKKYSSAFSTTGTGDGRIRELRISVTTGADDLRGGNDNFNLTVHYKDGTNFTFKNVNKQTAWGGNTTKEVTLRMNKYVQLSEIKGFTVTTTFGGGLFGDNWNMNALSITAFGGGVERNIYFGEGNPLVRFTGNNQPFNVVATVE